MSFCDPQFWLGVFTFISSLLLLWQLIVIRRQNANDHERSRRETVINLQKIWLDCCGRSPRYIKQLLKSMTSDACSKFWKGEPFSMPYSCRHLLAKLLECEECATANEENKEIIVKDNSLVLFRKHLCDYLNLLELISTAWLDNVGDRSMIEREFGKNISGEDGNFPLDNIINCAPAFPSIKAFSNDLRRKLDATSKKPL
ncbi:MAG: hypothetical protein LBH06_09250 [Rikenellaceae bacterium]|jgi:hypothetical protein|nr:hypothetical protein [Rikenellaceae bacterium]